jgi:sensor c-di-GMP phosphodiesterase-like protein
MAEGEMKIDYDKTESIHRNAEKALDFARQIFAQENFIVSEIRSGELQIVNTRKMMNNHQNPLMVVSRATVSTTESSINIQAELRNDKFLMRILGLLIIVLVGLFFILPLKPHSIIKNPMLASLLFGAPWLLFLPLMRLAYMKNARKALDAMLQNAANATR